MISIKKYILLNITYCRMRKISMLNTTHVWHHWNNKIQNLHDVFNFFIAGDFLKYWLAVVIDKSFLIVEIPNLEVSYTFGQFQYTEWAAK